MSTLVSHPWTNPEVKNRLVEYLSSGFSLRSIAEWILTGAPPTEKTFVRHDKAPSFWLILVDGIVALAIGGSYVLGMREQKTIFGVPGSLEFISMFELNLFSEVKEDYRTSGKLNMDILVQKLLKEYGPVRNELRTNALKFTPPLFHHIIDQVFAEGSMAADGGSTQP